MFTALSRVVCLNEELYSMLCLKGFYFRLVMLCMDLFDCLAPNTSLIVLPDCVSAGRPTEWPVTNQQSGAWPVLSSVQEEVQPAVKTPPTAAVKTVES